MSDGHIKSEVSVSPIGHFQKSAALEIYLGIFGVYLVLKGLPGGTGGKEPVCQCRRCKRHKFDPWVRKIPQRRAWQPTPSFLKNPTDRGAWQAVAYKDCKESDRSEAT